MKTTILVIIGVLILSSISYGSYHWWPKDKTADWQEFNNINGYSIKIPKGIEIGGNDFRATDYQLSSTVILFKSNNQGNQSSIGFNPLMAIDVVQKTNLDLKEEAEKIFKENIYPKGLAPSPVLKDFRKELFLEKNSFQFSLKIKGLIGPSGEFLIKQETAYNYIVAESNNNKYFILIYPDDAEFNQILSTFKFTK